MKPQQKHYALLITLGFLSIGTLVAPLKYTFATGGVIRFIVIISFLIIAFLQCLLEFTENVREIGS